MNEWSTRRIRAAMLGTGAWSRVLTRAARSCELLDVSACWGRTPDRVREFAEQMGVRAVMDLHRILSDRDIDAVIVALSNQHHREYTELAARHGKHVLVEKPIAHTLADGVAMLELETRYGVRIGVAHCARMLTGNRFMREAIARGELGRVSLLEARFTND